MAMYGNPKLVDESKSIKYSYAWTSGARSYMEEITVRYEQDGLATDTASQIGSPGTGYVCIDYGKNIKGKFATFFSVWTLKTAWQLG